MKPTPPRRIWWLPIIIVRSFAIAILILALVLISLSAIIHNIATSTLFSRNLHNYIKILIIPDLESKTTPDPGSLNQAQINQSMKVTVELTSKDNSTLLSQLQGSVGQTNSTLQQLLGNQNMACISAYLDADPDQFNVEPTQTQEYPLNQTSILWSWIITPKHTGANFFDISFSAAGKSACAPDRDPIVGPYSLGEGVPYSLNVIDPSSTPTPTATPTPPVNPPANNPFVEIYNALGVGTIITGVLTTLIAAFMTWICTQAWKRRKDKIQAHTTSEAPAKPDPSPGNDSPGDARHDQDQHTVVP